MNTHWPVFFCWRAKCPEDSFELVHVALTRKVRRSQHELSKYAAYRPHVDRRAIVPTAKQQFWWSIPSARVSEANTNQLSNNAPSDDLACHFVSWVCEISCQTEIRDFQLSVRRNEQVVGLQILGQDVMNGESGRYRA
jgi:hypothetical protein